MACKFLKFETIGYNEIGCIEKRPFALASGKIMRVSPARTFEGSDGLRVETCRIDIGHGETALVIGSLDEVLGTLNG